MRKKLISKHDRFENHITINETALIYYKMLSVINILRKYIPKMP